MERLHFPHVNVLVIRLHVPNFLVKRVSVDEGSSTKVLFLFILKRMRYDKRNIKKETMKLVAFNDTRSTVMGKMVMHITLRKKTIFFHNVGGR